MSDLVAGASDDFFTGPAIQFEKTIVYVQYLVVTSHHHHTFVHPVENAAEVILGSPQCRIGDMLVLHGALQAAGREIGDHGQYKKADYCWYVGYRLSNGDSTDGDDHQAAQTGRDETCPRRQQDTGRKDGNGKRQ